MEIDRGTATVQVTAEPEPVTARLNGLAVKLRAIDVTLESVLPLVPPPQHPAQNGMEEPPSVLTTLKECEALAHAIDDKAERIRALVGRL